MLDHSPATLLLASLPDGIVMSNRRQQITFINPAAARLLELDSDQWVQRPLRDLCVHYAIPAPHTLATRKRLIFGPGRTFSVQRLPLAPESARADIGVCLLLSAEAERRDAHTLIATMSHELRMPVTVIRGFADLLLRGLAGALTDEQREFITCIRARTGNLATLISRFIALSDVLWQVGGDPAPQVDVADLVEEVAQYTARSYADRGIQLTLPGRALAYRATTHDHLLRAMLLQIIDNAFRYTPDGGAVTIALEHFGDQVAITIRDTGSGIPRDLQAALLAPGAAINYPAQLSQPQPAFGYAIVRACLQRTSAAITLTSAEGAGTTVRISLPAASSSAHAPGDEPA